MRDGTRTRQILERSALRLFVDKGIAQTTTRDIATAAGIAEGTLYRHFRGKDELAWRLFEANFESLAGRLEAAIRDTKDCSSAIRAIVAELCRMFDTERYAFRYVLVPQHNQSRNVTKLTKSPISVLRQVIERGIASAEISVTNPDLATAFALGPVTQTAAAIIAKQLPGPMEQWQTQISTATVRALGMR